MISYRQKYSLGAVLVALAVLIVLSDGEATVRVSPADHDSRLTLPITSSVSQSFWQNYTESLHQGRPGSSVVAIFLVEDRACSLVYNEVQAFSKRLGERGIPSVLLLFGLDPTRAHRFAASTDLALPILFVGSTEIPRSAVLSRDGVIAKQQLLFIDAGTNRVVRSGILSTAITSIALKDRVIGEAMELSQDNAWTSLGPR